jgi:phosphocarrier protein HPr
MAEREATVGPEEGLHGRPAAQFVKTAKQFSSKIVVVKGEREVNAKSPLKLMTLGTKRGDKVVIRAEGDDAEEAVNALVEFISSNDISRTGSRHKEPRGRW